VTHFFGNIKQANLFSKMTVKHKYYHTLLNILMHFKNNNNMDEQR